MYIYVHIYMNVYGSGALLVCAMQHVCPRAADVYVFQCIDFGTHIDTDLGTQTDIHIHIY